MTLYKLYATIDLQTRNGGTQMKIINKINGEVIAEIITNHSMTIEEALELVGERFETDDPSFDDPDFIVDGEEVWVEDCEMEW